MSITAEEPELKAAPESSKITEEELPIEYDLYKSPSGTIHQITLQGPHLPEPEDGTYILSCLVSKGSAKQYLIQWQYTEAGDDPITGDLISTTDLEVALSNFSAWYENKTGKKWGELGADSGGVQDVVKGVSEGDEGIVEVKGLNIEQKLWLLYQARAKAEDMEMGKLNAIAQEAEVAMSGIKKDGEMGCKVDAGTAAMSESGNLSPDHSEGEESSC